MPAGRPTELNEQLCLKIRSFVLEGKTLEKIAELTEIPYKTMEGWVTRNYNGFADKWRLYKTELRLKRAEEFGDELMMKPNDDKDILRLKQKEAEFVRETVGKSIYSKRNELTGKDGEQLNTVVSFNYVKPDNTDNQANTETGSSMEQATRQDD